MSTKVRFKLKPRVLRIIKIVGISLAIVLTLFIFYRANINDLKKIGYSEEAAKKIFISFKKKTVLDIGENKTLNKAFESKDYKEKNFDHYYKIKYQNQKNIIKNINRLIKIGYTNDEISTILSHGNDQEVEEFSKRKKVRYLDEFFSIDYARLKHYDRYVEYMNNSRDDEETSVLYVNLDLDKEDYQEANTIDNFSYTMLVNKHNQLKNDFRPDELVSVKGNYAKEKGVKANKKALDKAKKMIDQAEKEGFHLVINSAYRSYNEQEELEKTYLDLYGQDYVDKYVLKPGFSEHQTGLGFDFGSKDTKVFATSDEYKWIVDNCYKYGFIYRFKTSYEMVTGIKSESWHYRYVGEKVAKYIYDNDITLEEYYAKFIEK